MAIEIGTVNGIIGTAIVIREHGKQSFLQENEAVYQNDIITTREASAIEIQFLDGSIMAMGHYSQMLLDDIVFEFNGHPLDTENVILNNDELLYHEVLSNEIATTEEGHQQAAEANNTDVGSQSDILQEQTTVLIGDVDTPFIPGSLTQLIQDAAKIETLQLTVAQTEQATTDPFSGGYGYYIKDADQQPTKGGIIWGDVNQVEQAASFIIDGATQTDIGFFLIPESDAANNALLSGLALNTEVDFQREKGEWVASINSIEYHHATVLFDQPVLNTAANQQSAERGFEGMSVDNSWATVSVTRHITTDTPIEGEFDFKLDDMTIDGQLTSQGNEVTFEVANTDDALIARADNQKVLSIENILDIDGYKVTLLEPLESSYSGPQEANLKIMANMIGKQGAHGALNLTIDIEELLPPEII